MTARRTVRRPRAAALAWPVVCAQALWLVGCGGGGSDAGSPLPNRLPVATAVVSGDAVANATTVFNTTGTTDPDGSIVSRSWDYGDGQSGSADSHVYTAVRSYNATLTVIDNTGATASTTLAVAVAKCSADGLLLAAGSPAPNQVVCLQTSKGELVLELFTAQAPVSVANFLKYVDDGFYSNTLFHRHYTPNPLIQGGGFTAGMVEKAATQPAIVLESNNRLSNTAYTVGMARTNVANSATSQFYINLADNTGFDYRSPSSPGYAVFGQVLATTQRQAVLDAIAAVPTTTVGGYPDVPTPEVFVRSAVRVP